jgi:multidrug efflux pump subunit AcrA (membrane-fusion protein)
MVQFVNLAAEKPQPANPLLPLVQLSRRARLAGSAEELAFLVVNESHAFFPYRQGALWFADHGITTLSGIIEPEANAPYAQWLNRLCRFLHENYSETAAIAAVQLPTELAEEWSDWLPPHVLWMPLSNPREQSGTGGLLLAAERPWPEQAVALLEEWAAVWHYAWLARTQVNGWSWQRLKQAILGGAGKANRPWWKQRRIALAVIVLAAGMFPVRLSVLAPGELTPTNPAVIRAPMEGVIGQFQVQPNQTVKAGQPLFNFDEAQIAARYEVAAQAFATAQTEYRQYAQQAVSDVKSKAQLAMILGKIEEKRAEAGYLKGQFERSRVIAPQDGVVLFDDPTEWIGKPVQTGERIMRIAAPGDVEVEAWLPIGDAIALPENAEVKLYLASSPLTPISARVRYVAHDAAPRPDGTYAYRIRARLDGQTNLRVGLKGTAKIDGDKVTLIYWVLRRPLATIRQVLGL